MKNDLVNIQVRTFTLHNTMTTTPMPNPLGYATDAKTVWSFVYYGKTDVADNSIQQILQTKREISRA